jgi:hypothetical protein
MRDRWGMRGGENGDMFDLSGKRFFLDRTETFFPKQQGNNYFPAKEKKYSREKVTSHNCFFSFTERFFVLTKKGDIS